MRFDDDGLRCRFTAWMKIVVIRKKLEYIRKLKRHKSEVSFEDGKLHDLAVVCCFLSKLSVLKEIGN